MQAVVYDSFQGDVEVRTVPKPKASPDSVVIKVIATGVCRSDWHGYMGHDPDIQLPHVPGHELAGKIAEVGSNVKNFSLGQRVTVPFVSGCGKCNMCHSGNQHICDTQFQPGFTAWGSFAEFVEIDYADQNVVLLPQGIDFAVAAR
jgi:alcohol dehydrogenase